jgi:hypothetical protein
LELAHPLHCDIRRRVLFDDLFLWADLAGHVAADPAGLGRQGPNRRSGVEPAEARVSAVSVETVSRTMAVLLAREGRRIVYRDRATGQDLVVSPPSAASPAGLLPAFVVAGEAVWREATGKGFSLDIVRNPQALLGYRLRGIGAGHFATVMLATMEATAQVAEPSAIVVNELNTLWSAATDRIERQTRLSPQAGAGAAP